MVYDAGCKRQSARASHRTPDLLVMFGAEGAKATPLILLELGHLGRVDEGMCCTRQLSDRPDALERGDRPPNAVNSGSAAVAQIVVEYCVRRRSLEFCHVLLNWVGQRSRRQ